MAYLTFSALFICCLFTHSIGRSINNNTVDPKNNNVINLRNLIPETRELARVNEKSFFNLESYAGFITVKEEYNSNLYFWYFPSKSKPLNDTPWIIWLQGGPGFSSLVGLFSLIGPLKLEDGEVKLRNVSWIDDYSLVFIDNPVGAGFSFTDNDNGYPSDDYDVGDQLHVFVSKFLKIFPELRTAPLFIAGESYAGKYVPALGIHIHRRKDVEPINLKGLAIGNGLIDLTTSLHYSELCDVMGFLDDDEVKELEKLEKKTKYLISKDQIVDASNAFNETVEYIKKKSQISIYNFNEDPGSSANPLEIFLSSPEIRKLIHVGNKTFEYNNQYVYNKMLPTIAKTSKPWIDELLGHYGVMGYNGQLDIILAYGLTKHTYDAFEWPKKLEFTSAKREVLKLKGKVQGYMKSGGNFVEAIIRNAGHMAPQDNPEGTKLIYDLFINQFKHGTDGKTTSSNQVLKENLS